MAWEPASTSPSCHPEPAIRHAGKAGTVTSERRDHLLVPLSWRRGVLGRLAGESQASRDLDDGAEGAFETVTIVRWPLAPVLMMNTGSAGHPEILQVDRGFGAHLDGCGTPGARQSSSRLLAGIEGDANVPKRAK